jgi:hypothetical protein
MADLLSLLSSNVPAPVVYAPGSVIDSELADIVAVLVANRSMENGARTEHLASLIEPSIASPVGLAVASAISVPEPASAAVVLGLLALHTLGKGRIRR